MEKNEIINRQNKILELAREFCAKKLDEEYFELAEKLINKLGRKRNVPFETGKPEVWAAAVIHALGSINFLFDKDHTPYASNNDINDFFGTNKNTVTGKSKIIRDMFKMTHWDSEFSTKRMTDRNPFKNLVEVDGFIVPVTSLPEEYQEMVKQARAEGRDISFRTTR